MKKQGDRFNSIFVAIVGCVFLVFASFPLRHIIQNVSDSKRLKNALVIQASVLEVDSKLGGSGRSGGGSRTEATYEFEHSGKRFRSNKLTIFADSRFLYQPLADAMESNRTIECFVDPNDPSLSVLNKDFRLWPFLGLLILTLTFGGIGLACLIQELRNRIRNQEAESEIVTPSKPFN